MNIKCYTLSFLLVFGFLSKFKAIAQCTDWQVTTQVIAGSTCAGNGSFSVSLSGADAPNITHVQYGISTNGSPNGYSVPLNNSNLFTNVPPGSYQVSVVGVCNGDYIGKNAWVTIPGTYKPPTLTLQLARHNLSCGKYGIVNISVNNNRPPYTLTITSRPPSYTGPASFTMTGSTFAVRELPGGNYTMQVVDVCGNSSFLTTINVPDYAPGTIDLISGNVQGIACDSLYIWTPSLALGSSWGGYKSDTLYKVSVQISNGAFAPAGFIPLNEFGWGVKLLPGFSMKDCYGQTLIYTIQPPCGNTFQIFAPVQSPYLNTSVEQKCNVGFVAFLSFGGLLCTPVTYTIKDINSTASYGPYTASNYITTSPTLPLGSYVIQYTTADGFTGNTTVSASPIVGNPYQVSAIPGINGMHNYVQGFQFSTAASLGNKTIELFSGPAGYTYKNTWIGNFTIVTANQTPSTSGTEFFPAGNYVWKITDSCGVYYLPVSVTAQDLYQYTTGIVKQYETCQGLWVFPNGTSTNNGQPRPVEFSFLKDGLPVFYTTPTSGIWKSFRPGDSVLITEPGTYTILPFTAPTLFIYNGSNGPTYPNPYTRTFSFNYNRSPVQIDVYKTGGYACQAGSPAIINTQGKDGVPFSGSSYRYYLAKPNNGIGGPYIANNTTGVFTNFGGAADSVYEVKVVDSCGSFAIQKVKILNLQQTRLISNSDYVACEGDDVTLYVPYFANATYTWTGPGGFNATTATVTLHDVKPNQSGIYYLSVAIPNCNTLVRDSTIVVVHARPAAPLISYHCGPPLQLAVSNPQPEYNYLWEYSNLNPAGFSYYDFSDTVIISSPGMYRIAATDTVTGCVSLYSDTLTFPIVPATVFSASIYSPHLQLCAGDTTTLVADAHAYGYQWFLNGTIIPGATSQIYTTHVAGNYKVYVDGGACARDTSDEVTVTIIPYPIADIQAASLVICKDDTATLSTHYDPGYSYTWFLNGNSIPGEQSDSLKVFRQGLYYVVVSNGGCVVSDTVSVSIFPYTAEELDPGFPADTVLCDPSGQAVFSVSNLLTNILWSTGATTPSITVTQPGIYWIHGETPCGNVSDTVKVEFCAPEINDLILSSDTICEDMCLVMQSIVENYPQQYIWSFEGGNPSGYTGENPPTVCYEHPGIYNIKLYVSNIGGVDSLAKEIVVLPNPEGRYVDTTMAIPYKTLISLPACGTASEINWYRDDSLICAGCDLLTLEAKLWRSVYTCVLKNGDCTDTCFYKVEVYNIPTDAWMPSAFSPNGDGRNDKFSVITDNPNIYIVDLSVYNKWGQQMYRSNGREGWDGTFKGTPVEQGVYFWSLKYKVANNGKLFEMKGDVTVVR